MNEHKTRILVADDEQGIREGCRRALNRQGFTVATAADGIEALEAWDREPGFSAALIDLQMPRLGGLELIEKLTARDTDLVIIIITAHATITTAVEGTKRGAFGYIPKPFTADELLLCVRNGLQRRSLALETRRLREEKEKRLLEVASEQSKCNTILKCISDGLLVINLEKLVVLRNAAAARIFPRNARTQIPFALEELGYPEVGELIDEVLGCNSGPRIISRELPLENHTYMVNASPVVEPGGSTSGAVAVFRDISELKDLQSAKSTFVSMVAHELKSPLAAAEGWLNLILSGSVETEPDEERHMIERSALRLRTLRTLISELLSITAIETGNFYLHRRPVDVAEIVRNSVESEREKAEAKGIELQLSVETAKAGETALADRDALSLVFSNLIDNAVKYTNERGRVSVAVSYNGSYVRVSVEDTGLGIAEQELDKIFEEFYRSRNEHTASIPGTGLGLSLVKRLVEMHQGHIEVKSALGTGTTFTVNLPL